jgi:predicted nucleic acid-binding protein
MDYVMDASYAGSLIIPDEFKQSNADFMRKLDDTETVWIPELFWYEIGNLFKNLILRGRYKFEEITLFYPKLKAYRFTIDAENGPDYSERVLRVAKTYKLSAYDAAYLELAGRRKAPLCTLDGDLRRAAPDYGVRLAG